jgi:hypothetical protein
MKLAAVLIGLVLAGCGDGKPDGYLPPGDYGEPGEIISSISCTGDLSTFSDGMRTLNGKTISGFYSAAYKVSVIRNGDILVVGEIYAPSAGLSKSNFYSKRQIGALLGSVAVRLDSLLEDNSGTWSISTDRVTKIMTVRYTDIDFAMAPNFLEWSFPASACTKDL